MHITKLNLWRKKQRNIHAVLFYDSNHWWLTRQWNNASMCCQVLPLVRRIEVSYWHQLYADVQCFTRRVNVVNEEVAKLPVTSKTEQKSGPCRVVRGPCVATATLQQSRCQTSVISMPACTIRIVVGSKKVLSILCCYFTAKVINVNYFTY